MTNPNYSLAADEPSAAPARFPASLAAKMVQNKIRNARCKTLVLVASEDTGLREALRAFAVSEQFGVSYKPGAEVFGNTVNTKGAPRCRMVLADDQSNRIFSNIAVANDGTAVQVIALHDGALDTTSAFGLVARYLEATPLQLERGL